MDDLWREDTPIYRLEGLWVGLKRNGGPRFDVRGGGFERTSGRSKSFFIKEFLVSKLIKYMGKSSPSTLGIKENNFKFLGTGQGELKIPNK